MSESIENPAAVAPAAGLLSGRRRMSERLRSILSGDFVRKVLATFTTRIVLIGIGLVTTVVVARILGPEGRGLYAVAMAIGALGLQFGTLGLHAANVYFVAKDRTLLSKLVGNSLVVSCVIGAVAIVISYSVFAVWPKFAPLHGALLLLGLLWIPIGIAYLLTQNLLLGVSEIGTYNRAEVVNRALVLVFLGCLVLAHKVNAELVVAGGLVAMTAMLAVIVLRLAKVSGLGTACVFRSFQSDFRIWDARVLDMFLLLPGDSIRPADVEVYAWG